MHELPQSHCGDNGINVVCHVKMPKCICKKLILFLLKFKFSPVSKAVTTGVLRQGVISVPILNMPSNGYKFPDSSE